MEQRKCPVCGKGSLHAHSDRSVSIGPKGKKVTISTLEYSTCDSCNVTVVLPAQLRANKQKIREAQATLVDYISPAQVLELRETYEISQKVAAQIFGGGANAFSKYERGEVTPSATAARTMLRALRDSAFFETLAREKGFPYGVVAAKPAEVFLQAGANLLQGLSTDIADNVRRYSESSRLSVTDALLVLIKAGMEVMARKPVTQAEPQAPFAPIEHQASYTAVYSQADAVVLRDNPYVYIADQSASGMYAFDRKAHYHEQPRQRNSNLRGRREWRAIRNKQQQDCF
ncbi:type II TA system antitoxin MqsA family protein [Ralstonia pseudosolanacearum]